MTAYPVAETDTVDIATRGAFTRYVAELLGSLISQAAPLSGGGPAAIATFRLRSLHPDLPAVPVVAGEPVPDLPASHLTALLRLTTPQAGPLALRTARADAGASVDWDHRGDLGVDFVFSYPTAPADVTPARYPALLLTALLDVVDLYDADGRTVVPDAVGGPAGAVPLSLPAPWSPPELGARADGKNGTGHHQPLHSVAATEPAIVCLARHWGLLTGVVSVYHQDTAVQVDGFRLRQLADWVVPADGHPAEVYEYLARVCNVACDFCYLYGNPTTLAVARGSKVIKDTELDTRLRYWAPDGKRSLFHAQWEINEFLVDPKVHTLLPALRERTAEPFYFITNGSPLKGRVLDLLEAVKPVHLIVSINSLDEDLRGSIMHEKTGQTTTAVGALRELVARGIPFGISLAAFPDFPLDDLMRTIRIVDEIGAGFVRVNQPGFTRELPYQGSFDTQEQWNAVMHAVRDVRGQVSLPVFSIPSAFEENLHTDDPLGARVIGAVPNSPAARAGLRPGDVVCSVNGFSMRTRADILPLLLLARQRAKLTITRDGQPLELELTGHDDFRYPYDGDVLCKYVFPWGVVVSPSLSAAAAMQIRADVTAVGARSPWLVTSTIMRPAAEALLRRFQPDLLAEIRFIEPTNEFLGGNIRVLDMATIGDIGLAVDRERAASGQRPDLLFVPESGFNRHGRDLQGRHWRDLERYFGCPVRLLTVSRFSY